jgi:diguanylate cyclase (GGDEF)-like protein
MVLRQFALTVKKNVRRPTSWPVRRGRISGHLQCRPGGDAEIAERVRQAVETEKVVLPEGQEVSITASFGVGICRSGDSVRTLVERADSALYNAKQSGRNVVKEESGDN